MQKHISIPHSINYTIKRVKLVDGLTLVSNIVTFLENTFSFLTPPIQKETLNQCIAKTHQDIANAKKRKPSIHELNIVSKHIIDDLTSIKSQSLLTVSKLKQTVQTILSDTFPKKELLSILDLTELLLYDKPITLLQENLRKRYPKTLEKIEKSLEDRYKQYIEDSRFHTDRQFKTVLYPYHSQLHAVNPLLDQCISLNNDLYYQRSESSSFVSSSDTTKARYYLWYTYSNSTEIKSLLTLYKEYLLEKKTTIQRHTQTINDKMGEHSSHYIRLTHRLLLDTRWLSIVNQYIENNDTQQHKSSSAMLCRHYMFITSDKLRAYAYPLSKQEVVQHCLSPIDSNEHLSPEQLLLDLKNKLSEIKDTLYERESSLTKNNSISIKSTAALIYLTMQTPYYSLGESLFNEMKKEYLYTLKQTRPDINEQTLFDEFKTLFPTLHPFVSKETCSKTFSILGNLLHLYIDPNYLLSNTITHLFREHSSLFIPIVDAIDTYSTHTLHTVTHTLGFKNEPQFDKLGILQKENIALLAISFSMFNHINKDHSMGYNLMLFVLGQCINKGVNRVIDEGLHRTTLRSSHRNMIKTLILFLMLPFSLQACLLLNRFLFSTGTHSSPSNNLEFNTCNDAHAQLGTSSSMSLSQVKKAYRNAALIHHPDKGGSDVTMRLINSANEFIKDPQNHCLK